MGYNLSNVSAERTHSNSSNVSAERTLNLTNVNYEVKEAPKEEQKKRFINSVFTASAYGH